MRIEDTFITFAGRIATKKKVEKDIKVKGHVRKGKFVQAFQRKQNVNDKTEVAKKVAIGSLTVLGGVLGIGLASAAVVKLRYNNNLVTFGKQIKANEFPIDMPHPKKNYITPYNIGDKKSTNFFIGPLSDKGKSGGAGLMKSTRIALKDTPKLKENYEMIPLFHNYQVSGNDEFGFATSAIDATKKAVKDGYNMDSVLMAKEIHKWHLLNPTKPINLITHSAGGFQGRDIPHILQAAGVNTKLIKVFSMGSPDYGLVDDIVPVVRAMNSDDLYTNKIKKLVSQSRNSVPSLNRNSTYVGNGYTPAFEKMRYDKALKEADLTGDYTQVDLPKNQQKAVAHSLEAYMNGETLASKKTIKLLKDFMFKN